MAEIARLVRRGADLTGQLTACSGRPLCRMQAVLLARVVEAGIGDAREPNVPANRIQISAESDLPPIGCDPDLARRAVANLVANALEATADAGTPVQVRVRMESVAQPVSVTCPPGMILLPNRYQVVEVVDSGPGMMQETLEHIFDPFFSTRFIGRGLGLSATLGIMRAHGGMVELVSEPGRGTKARLWFPEELQRAQVDSQKPDVAAQKN